MNFEQAATRTESDVENFEDWKKLKETAALEAKELIAAIPEYETAEPTEQIVLLKELLVSLSEDNRNRYVAQIIGNHIVATEELIRHQTAMSRVQAANPDVAA